MLSGRVGKVRKSSTFSTRLFRFLSTTDKPCECDENSSLAPILCKMCVRDLDNVVGQQKHQSCVIFMLRLFYLFQIFSSVRSI